MLRVEKIAEVQQLLATGKSHRAIALAAGVSRSSVARIAASDGRQAPPPAAPTGLSEPLGPIVRCPTCGGRVHSPCLACQVRGIKLAARIAARTRTSRVAPRRAG